MPLFTYTVERIERNARDITVEADTDAEARILLLEGDEDDDIEPEAWSKNWDNGGGEINYRILDPCEPSADGSSPTEAFMAGLAEGDSNDREISCLGAALTDAVRRLTPEARADFESCLPELLAFH